jgi:DHA1 family bicyclomycin/chloramphenicol resistance-like MFS transporter
MSFASTNRPALLLLAAIGTITPLAIDLYLPALPQIALLLDVPMQRIESSVSTYMIGLAIGVLIGAAVSDRVGRKPSVVGGLLLFALCSVGIGLTDNGDVFLALRVVQAFGGGFAFVNIPAIVRDLFDEQDSARAFTMITIIALVAPLIAPTIGSTIMLFFSWRAIFFALACYALALCALVFLYLPETSPADPDRRSKGVFAQVGANVARVMRNREAVALVICQGFVFAVMFSFVADASFAYMVHFKLDAWTFSLLFGANIATLMAFNRVNKRLLVKRRPFTIVPLGIALQVGSTAILTTAVLAGADSLALFVPLIMLAVGAHALVTPNIMASFMAHFGRGAGTASGVITGAQYLTAGLISLCAALVHDGTLITTSLTMLLSALGALIALGFARQRRAERLARETLNAATQVAPR